MDQNDVIRGMDAFKTEFRYELSRETVGDDDEEGEELTPRHNMFARRGGDPGLHPHRGHKVHQGHTVRPPWNQWPV